MTLKLCVFPTDPIIEYFKKGEIKDRYFNPLDLFDEIHISQNELRYADILKF